MFAPSEAALAELDRDTLCSTPEALADILLYHVVGQVLPSTMISEGKSHFETMQGSDLTLVHTNAGCETASLAVNEALAISIDVGANNGVMHVIDQVLSAPPAKAPKGAEKDKGAKKGMDRRRRFLM